MMSARQLASSLWGVWLLLRWDSSGFAFFDRSFSGFRGSYLVAIALAPVHAAHWYITYPPSIGKVPFAVHMFTEFLSYVMSWTAYPLAMVYVARLIDRDNRYFDYMVAYNWFQIALVGMWLPIALLDDINVLDPQSASFLGLIVLGVGIAYGVFLARQALLVSTLTGVGLVLIDILVTTLISQVIGLV